MADESLIQPNDDLGFDFSQALHWFPHLQDNPYVLVRVGDEHVQAWADALGVAVRRCYITDDLLEDRSVKNNIPQTDILAAKLPDPGATMAGDFGEILVYFYQAAKEHRSAVIGPKKWRLKQDRTKPAPHSDVVQFVLPSWPEFSPQDVLLCSEVKSKATDDRRTSPIKSAIDDCAKDRTSRLGRTLNWLKERAMLEDLGDVTIKIIERFIKHDAYPEAEKRYRAVAVVCSSLIDGELGDAPVQTPDGYSVVVISVPQLKRTYNAVFEAARQSVSELAPPVCESEAR